MTQIRSKIILLSMLFGFGQHIWSASLASRFDSKNRFAVLAEEDGLLPDSPKVNYLSGIVFPIEIKEVKVKDLGRVSEFFSKDSRDGNQIKIVSKYVGRRSGFKGREFYEWEIGNDSKKCVRYYTKSGAISYLVAKKTRKEAPV